MGFREQRTVYVLKFDGRFEGLIVKATFPPMGVLDAVRTSMGEVAGLVGKDTKDFTAEEVASAIGSETLIIDAFLDNLVEWNVEEPESGDPIPATREGLARVSSTLGQHVIKTWWEYVSGDVPDPLGQPSNSGRPYPEASLPMESLSPSPQSLIGPSVSSAAVSGSGASRVS